MNSVDYVTEYEYATSALLAVLLGLYLMRRRFRTSTNKLYLMMLVFTLVSSTLHIFTTKTLPHAERYPLWLNYALNIAYMLTFTLIPVIYMVYITALTKKQHIDIHDKVIATTSFFLNVILILTTPFAKLVFYFDESNNYLHGPLFMALPVIAVALFTYSFMLFIKYRKRMKRNLTVAVTVFAATTLAANIVQIVRPSQIIGNFSIALSMILFFITIENPADYVDNGTGCLNSDAFYITLNTLIERSGRFTVTAFRTEGLNYISGIIGSVEGGKEFTKLANSLKGHLGKRDLFSLGNWEFAIISNEKRGESADELVGIIQSFFSKPISVNGIEIRVTPFICKLHYPDFADSVADIRTAIDYTLRSMVSSNKNVLDVTREAIEAKQREVHILASIKQHIADRSFEVYYQPLFDVKSGTFRSAEALIRMRDSELGFVSPEEFIPLAEANGLIVQIGEFVFRKVCELFSSGKPQALGVEYIEVNLSTLQCVQEKLAARVMEIMEEYGVRPELINFEITETAGLANYDVLLSNMNALIEHGVSFSMDDFGTGFSTANYLIQLPMDIVKIDKSILWAAMEDKEAFIVLRHTIEMLKSLNKKIVVEGVETAEMVKLLSEIGCDYLQGYYFSKPVPPDEYISFLEKKVLSAKQR